MGARQRPRSGRVRTQLRMVRAGCQTSFLFFRLGSRRARKRVSTANARSGTRWQQVCPAREPKRWTHKKFLRGETQQVHGNPVGCAFTAHRTGARDVARCAMNAHPPLCLRQIDFFKVFWQAISHGHVGQHTQCRVRQSGLYEICFTPSQRLKLQINRNRQLAVASTDPSIDRRKIGGFGKSENQTHRFERCIIDISDPPQHWFKRITSFQHH